MQLRTQLAITAAKAALTACHLAGRPGSSLPGRIALKVNPNLLSDLSSGIRRGIIVTCGTNGKTTTNNLLCSALEALGFRVVSNRLGANMMEGVAASLALSASLLKGTDADFACLEIDEASSAHVLKYLTPDYMILTNLFRDQLDRYGEIDLTMKALESAIRLAPDMTLVVNGDDPLTAFLAQKTGHPVVSFGVSENVTGNSASTDASSAEIRESRFCENCGAPLQYEFYHFSQLGVYHCPSCGFQRPAIRYDASGVRLSPQLSFDVREAAPAVPGTSAPVRLCAPMTGFYNIYNILAVYSVLRELGLLTDKLSEVLRGYKPQFGRSELFHVGENGRQRVLLNLAKNPAGFNQNIAAMLQDRSPKDLIIVINDNAQDGRDVSWLWDVDFDRLSDPSIRSVTVSGLRALDMQLRLKYVEIPSTAVPTVEEAINRRLSDGCGNLYVLVNYTALYEAHTYLERIQK